MPSPPEAALDRTSPVGAADGPCDACLRRTFLLGVAAPFVERARHQRRLGGLLALSDEDLLAAVGGGRRDELRAALAGWDGAAMRAAAARAELVMVCRHDPGYPERLAQADDAPAVLHLA